MCQSWWAHNTCCIPPPSAPESSDPPELLYRQRVRSGGGGVAPGLVAGWRRQGKSMLFPWRELGSHPLSAAKAGSGLHPPPGWIQTGCTFSLESGESWLRLFCYPFNCIWYRCKAWAKERGGGKGEALKQRGYFFKKEDQENDSRAPLRMPKWSHKGTFHYWNFITPTWLNAKGREVGKEVCKL